MFLLKVINLVNLQWIVVEVGQQEIKLIFVLRFLFYFFIFSNTWLWDDGVCCAIKGFKFYGSSARWIAPSPPYSCRDCWWYTFPFRCMLWLIVILAINCLYVIWRKSKWDKAACIQLTIKHFRLKILTTVYARGIDCDK